jgi:hypothetical protein
MHERFLQMGQEITVPIGGAVIASKWLQCGQRTDNRIVHLQQPWEIRSPPDCRVGTDETAS